MKHFLPLLLIACLLFSACRKDSHDILTEPSPEDEPIVLVRSTVLGMVTDEEGHPLANARVTIRDEQISTASDGTFRFENIKVKKTNAVVTAQVSEYFQGVSQSSFRADGSSYVKVVLMSKGNAHVISSESATAVEIENGLRLSVPANAFKTEAGDVYQGKVSLYSRWIDPTDEKLGDIMPGALIAQTQDGNPAVLASYGMAALVFESESGALLELDPTKPIIMEIPIPVELQNDAPDEIDLWYFDLEKERWLVQGKCLKINNYYECIITSGGYWNCDVMLPAICLSGNILNNDSTPSAYLKVIVTDLTDNFIYWGYTDLEGFFCGSVPQGAELNITIKDLCDNVVYFEDIGPYAADTQLEDIYLDVVVQEYFLNIKGQVSHCVTDDIVSGHLAIRYPGKIRIVPFVDAVDYDMALKCVEFPALLITAYSAMQRFSTEEIQHTSFSNIDFGAVTTCEDLTDFIDLNVEGVDFWASPTRYYFKDNTTTPWLILEGLSGGGTLKIELRDYAGAGNYTTNAFMTTKNEAPLPDYPELSSASPDITVDISSDDGSFIIGTINGMAMDQFNTAQQIDGNFKIRKAP